MRGDMAWLKAASSSEEDLGSDRGAAALRASTPPVLASSTDFTALLTAQAAAGAPVLSAPPPPLPPPPSASLATARIREFRFYNLEPDGALRPGGARALTDRRGAGLLATYAVVGALYGALPALASPLLGALLGAPRFQVQAAHRALDAPWLWKAVGGALSDALPVRGLRRKPYMVLGWAIAFSALAFLGLAASPDAPAPRASVASGSGSTSGSGSSLGSASGSGSGSGDAAAQDLAWLYVAAMGVATVGTLLANVAADGLMIEWAQREPLAARGRTQTAAFATRCLTMFLADFLVDTLLNSRRFGGDYSWDIGANALFLFLAALALAALVAAVWCLDEDKATAPPGYCPDDSAGAATTTTAESTPGPPLELEVYAAAGGDADALGSPRRRSPVAVSRRQLWRLAQARAVWTLVLFMLLSTLLFAVTPLAATTFMTKWYVVVSADALAANNLVRGVVYSLALLATHRFLQSASWPAVFVLATVWVVAVRVVVAAVTVFNLARSQWVLMYIAGVLVAPATAARAMVSLLPIAETAPRGLEATTYGLVITAFNFGLLLADNAARWLGGQFGIQDIDDADADSLHARWTVMWAFLGAFAVQLASAGAATFLPRQRLEVQQLRYYGGYSAGAAGVVAVGLALALTYSVVSVALAAVKETSCLRVAGGDGC